MHHANGPRFRVDVPLGKLARWLRMMGFDTVWGPLPNLVENANDGRIWVKRSGRRSDTGTLFAVTQDKPLHQLEELARHLPLTPEMLRPFTRCVVCNRILTEAKREMLQGRLPDFVLETHTTFKQCSGCGRTFWPGSHVENSRRLMRRLFEGLKQDDHHA